MLSGRLDVKESQTTRINEVIRQTSTSHPRNDRLLVDWQLVVGASNLPVESETFSKRFWSPNAPLLEISLSHAAWHNDTVSGPKPRPCSTIWDLVKWDEKDNQGESAYWVQRLTPLLPMHRTRRRSIYLPALSLVPRLHAPIPYPILQHRRIRHIVKFILSFCGIAVSSVSLAGVDLVLNAVFLVDFSVSRCVRQCNLRFSTTQHPKFTIW